MTRVNKYHYHRFDIQFMLFVCGADHCLEGQPISTVLSRIQPKPFNWSRLCFLGAFPFISFNTKTSQTQGSIISICLSVPLLLISYILRQWQTTFLKHLALEAGCPGKQYIFCPKNINYKTVLKRTNECSLNCG